MVLRCSLYALATLPICFNVAPVFPVFPIRESVQAGIRITSGRGQSQFRLGLESVQAGPRGLQSVEIGLDLSSVQFSSVQIGLDLSSVQFRLDLI